MREPLFMLMKQSYDKMLDEACKEVKNQKAIAYYADEVAGFARRIADRAREENKRGGLVNPDGGDYPLKWMSQPDKE